MKLALVSIKVLEKVEIKLLKFCLNQKVEIYLSLNLKISLGLKKFKVIVLIKNLIF